MQFKNKVILVTGAASGIGRVTAQAFAKEGGIVIVSDINEVGGKETVAQIKAEGGEGIFIQADVTDFTAVEKLINAIITQYGRLDIGINNAGMAGPPTRTAETSLETWDQTIAVNTTSVFYCMKLELQQMQKQESGIIVNTASVAGLKGLPNNFAYVASKHAVVGMTKTAAMEYARNNIRINAICPVFTLTPMFDPEQIDEASAGLSRKLKRNIPMRRFADPIEMANTILWLCSDQASFVTGLAFPVDGGLTA